MLREEQPGTRAAADDGYMLLAVIVLVFLVLLALSVAAPTIATQLKRDREVEAAHRANQYVRAIRIYYQKFGHYPGSVEQLEKSNNQRFLRQRYLDPFTGKDDWRLIQVGQNKTTVKGFFGEDLPGIGGGLGAASGMQSGGGLSSGSSSGSSFGSPTGPGSGTGSSFGTGSSAGGSSFGSSGGSSSTGSGSGSTGIGEQNATDYKGGGGPIMGVGVPKSGDSILTVNEQTTYDTWEFLYDPRIEQMYAKGNLLGGGSAMGSGGSSSFGSGSGSGFGNTPGSGTGSSPFGGTNGAGGTNGTGSTPPTPQ